MTGEFDVGGDRFLIGYQGRPDEHQEALFLDLLTEVWQDHVPLEARHVILAINQRPSILVSARLADYRSVELGGRKGRVPWPLAEVGPAPFLFSCDRMRLFDLPKEWALMVIGEELAHAYLIAVKDPTHVDPPEIDDPAFRQYDEAREARMQDVLCNKWGFDAPEYAKMMEWCKRTESGLKPEKT